MHNTMVRILTVLLAILVLVNGSSVTLYYHEWCKLSANAIKIIQKVSKLEQFSSISIDIVRMSTESDKPSDNGKYQRHKHLIEVYPTIVFQQCGSNISFTYQNTLSVVELTYWIQVHCLQYLPQCTRKIKQNIPYYQIPQLQSSSKGLLEWVKQNPGIKLCPQSTSIMKTNISHFLTQVSNYPQFYKLFTHNVRNHLIKTEKTAIIAFFNSDKSPAVQDFLHYYKRITNIQNKSLQTTSYQIPRHQLNDLVFIEADIKRKIIRRLLDFLNINLSGGSKHATIIAMRFKQGQMHKALYEEDQVIQKTDYGSKFSFWVHQMVSLGNKKRIKNDKTECLSDHIVYRYSQNELDALKKHVELKRRIKLEGFFFPVVTLKKRWWSNSEGVGITLCLEGQQPIKDLNIEDAIDAITVNMLSVKNEQL